MSRLLLLFVFLIGSAGSAFGSEQFFPLDNGNFWEFRSTDGQHRFRVEATLPIASSKGVFHGVRGYVDGNRVQFLREAEGTGLFRFDMDTATEALLTSFNAVSNPTFPADLRPCGTVLGTVRAQRESVMLPSGFWRNTLKIEYQTATCGEAAVESEIYAPGIGLVQRTLRSGNTTRQFNLTYDRVSRQVILTGNFGLTSLMVFPPAEGQTALRMTLLSSGSYGGEAALVFQTSQSYDVLIRDGNGNKIWQYSDGKTFLPDSRTVQGSVAYDIEIPLAELPGKTIAPGLYTVEAWLTTDGPNRTHSSSTTIPIGDFGQPPASQTAINRTETRGGIGRPLPGRPMRY